MRQCENSVYRNRSRPCLQYQIGRCLGPCVSGLVSEEDYQQQVEYVRLFLSGKDQQVLNQLISRMEAASRDLRFEDAARIRDQIQAVRRVTEKQFVSGDGEDLDVISVAFDAGMACVYVLSSDRGRYLVAGAISRKYLAVRNWGGCANFCRAILFTRELRSDASC